ncbi:hypothetical protein FA13DRAFT_701210, partial [Coprinellus micaceus]
MYSLPIAVGILFVIIILFVLILIRRRRRRHPTPPSSLFQLLVGLRLRSSRQPAWCSSRLPRHFGVEETTSKLSELLGLVAALVSRATKVWEAEGAAGCFLGSV